MRSEGASTPRLFHSHGKNVGFILMSITVACSFLLSIAAVEGKTPGDWKCRTIYQLLTDRFAVGGGGSNCYDLGSYCGGDYKGLKEQLSYISGMGFDAIWITPVVKNTENGYHGYWAQDLYALNEHFGTETDLRDLIKECHSRDIWVMFDVVGNHVGPVGYDYGSINPFNKAEHYHDCNNCPSSCQIQDFGNQPQVEHCRLAGLPDLNQSNSFVYDQLTSWISSLVSSYSVDGLRIDTVPEVEKEFWSDFQNAANVYAVGEVYDGRVDYVAGYQGYVDALLSYPMFFTLRDVFQNQKSMYNIQNQVQTYSKYFKDTSILGNFIDNHDQTRFLYGQGDYWLYKNAITWILMAEGIPIIYYGTEQGFSGGSDPDNREILWTSSYNTDTDLYKYIQTVNNYRKTAQIWNYPQVQRYADDSFYAFTRGNTFVALTNGGTYQSKLTRTITYQPYLDGTVLCNLFWPDDDCITVANGQLEIDLMHGEAKIYYPIQKEE